MEMICVNNGTKSFKNQEVLSNINIVFESGKIYGIVGYNGSGKSVLLNVFVDFLLLTAEK